jgi:hypothetical protein
MTTDPKSWTILNTRKKTNNLIKLAYFLSCCHKKVEWENAGSGLDTSEGLPFLSG